VLYNMDRKGAPVATGKCRTDLGKCWLMLLALDAENLQQTL